jgi:hypothetical protein
MQKMIRKMLILIRNNLKPGATVSLLNIQPLKRKFAWLLAGNDTVTIRYNPTSIIKTRKMCKF